MANSPWRGGATRALVRPLRSVAESELRDVCEVPEAAAAVASELVAMAGPIGDEHARLLLRAVMVLLGEQSRGSSHLPLDPEAFGDDWPPGWNQEACEGFGALVASGECAAIIGPDLPLLIDKNALFSHRFFTAEVRFVSALERVFQSAPASLDANVPQGAVSEEQLAAVRAALQGPMVAIVGGPGTGKTTIALTIVRAALDAGVAPERIALAAPTGKAARRLTASIQGAAEREPSMTPMERAVFRKVEAAATLHRLLGYSAVERRFRYGDLRRLPHELLIVDEASMVDLHLMTRLLAASNDGARIVLLGDPDQLPSVGVGAVLRELTADPPVVPTVRLQHNFRLDAGDPGGASILAAAALVRDGTDDERIASALAPPTDAAALERVGCERVASDNLGVEQILDHWFERHVAAAERLALAGERYRLRDGSLESRDADALRDLLRRSEAGRVLALSRRGPRGVETINQRLHERLALLTSRNGRFVPGDVVMMKRNDYRIELFNGDTGVVVETSGPRGDSLLAVFAAADGAPRAFPIARVLEDIELAHAMTVHKSQGSECDEALLFLPDQDGPLCTRQVLYTGLTRARTSVVVIGDEAVLDAALQRSMSRRSGLRARLERLALARPDL